MFNPLCKVFDYVIMYLCSYATCYYIHLKCNLDLY